MWCARHDFLLCVLIQTITDAQPFPVAIWSATTMRPFGYQSWPMHIGMHIVAKHFGGQSEKSATLHVRLWQAVLQSGLAAPAGVPTQGWDVVFDEVLGSWGYVRHQHVWSALELMLGAIHHVLYTLDCGFAISSDAADYIHCPQSLEWYLEQDPTYGRTQQPATCASSSSVVVTVAAAVTAHPLKTRKCLQVCSSVAFSQQQKSRLLVLAMH